MATLHTIITTIATITVSVSAKLRPYVYAAIYSGGHLKLIASPSRVISVAQEHAKTALLYSGPVIYLAAFGRFDPLLGSYMPQTLSALYEMPLAEIFPIAALHMFAHTS